MVFHREFRESRSENRSICCRRKPRARGLRYGGKPRKTASASVPDRSNQILPVVASGTLQILQAGSVRAESSFSRLDLGLFPQGLHLIEGCPVKIPAGPRELCLHVLE